jgi:hypothetical protein
MKSRRRPPRNLRRLLRQARNGRVLIVMRLPPKRQTTKKKKRSQPQRGVRLVVRLVAKQKIDLILCFETGIGVAQCVQIRFPIPMRDEAVCDAL